MQKEKYIGEINLPEFSLPNLSVDVASFTEDGTPEKNGVQVGCIEERARDEGACYRERHCPKTVMVWTLAGSRR